MKQKLQNNSRRNDREGAQVRRKKKKLEYSSSVKMILFSQISAFSVKED
jgi:hypothetical protein